MIHGNELSVVFLHHGSFNSGPMIQTPNFLESEDRNADLVGGMAWYGARKIWSWKMSQCLFELFRRYFKY
jgi:hypothetical protein